MRAEARFRHVDIKYLELIDWSETKQLVAIPIATDHNISDTIRREYAIETTSSGGKDASPFMATPHPKGHPQSTFRPTFPLLHQLRHPLHPTGLVWPEPALPPLLPL